MTILNKQQEIELIAKQLHSHYGALTLATKQTAEATNQHEQTLKQNRAQGIGIPYSKLNGAKNGTVRYSVFDIAEYIVNNKVKTHNRGF